MPFYKINLNRTVMENCTVEVESNSPEEAQDDAIDKYIGDHKWENPETIEISVNEWEEIDGPTPPPPKKWRVWFTKDIEFTRTVLVEADDENTAKALAEGEVENDPDCNWEETCPGPDREVIFQEVEEL